MKGNFAVSFQDNGKPHTLHPVTWRRSRPMSHSGFTFQNLFDDEKDRVDFYFYVKKVKIPQKESTGKVRASGRVSSPSAENSLDDVESMTP